MDMQPLMFSAVDWGDTHLIAKVKPISLLPKENDKQWLQLEYKPWSLLVFGQDREELWEEAQMQLSILWNWLVLEPDETRFCADVLKVKNALSEYWDSV